MTKWIDIRIEEEETMITRIEDKGRNMTDLGIIWKEETTEINIQIRIEDILIIIEEITSEEKEIETKDILKYIFIINFSCGNNLLGLYWDKATLLLLCNS